MGSYVNLDVPVGRAYYAERSSRNSKTLVVVCERSCLWCVFVLALMTVIKL